MKGRPWIQFIYFSASAERDEDNGTIKMGQQKKSSNESEKVPVNYIVDDR